MIYFLNLDDHHKNSEIVDVDYNLWAPFYLTLFLTNAHTPYREGKPLCYIYKSSPRSTVIKHIHFLTNYKKYNNLVSTIFSLLRTSFYVPWLH